MMLTTSSETMICLLKRVATTVCWNCCLLSVWRSQRKCRAFLFVAFLFCWFTPKVQQLHDMHIHRQQTYILEYCTYVRTYSYESVLSLAGTETTARRLCSSSSSSTSTSTRIHTCSRLHACPKCKSNTCMYTTYIHTGTYIHSSAGMEQSIWPRVLCPSPKAQRKRR